VGFIGALAAWNLGVQFLEALINRRSDPQNYSMKLSMLVYTISVSRNCEFYAVPEVKLISV
jgi:hypothetical protein